MNWWNRLEPNDLKFIGADCCGLLADHDDSNLWAIDNAITFLEQHWIEHDWENDTDPEATRDFLAATIVRLQVFRKNLHRFYVHKRPKLPAGGLDG